MKSFDIDFHNNFYHSIFEMLAESETSSMVRDLQQIASKIKAEVDAHGQDGPYGNQNCMLCTWAVELQLRGEDFLPRPVISEDDIIFEKGHHNFVKGGKKEKFSSVDELLTLIETGARYYCHVNWTDSDSGHEFLLVDDGDCTYIIDGQAGKVVPVAEDKEYFRDINFENSYIVRVDDKELDREVLKLNDLEQMSNPALESDVEDFLQESISSEELNIKSPEELMDWMNGNITYELVDDEYSNSNEVPTKTADEVLKTGKGHCAEQSYLEKEVLEDLGYETFLVMVKENNSKKEYGAEGSAHVFLVYKDEDGKFCWFEHSMQHSRGIHKYDSLEALLQDVANQWWRYDKNSDILEVRMMDKVITGVDNWGLAKECYKLPVEYTFDISNNILESEVPQEFDPPYNADQIKKEYGEEFYNSLKDDPAHQWRMETGLELIHQEPEVDELRRIWANWLLMTPEQKAESDEKSIELFGKTNAEHFGELITTYASEEVEEALETKIVRRDNPNDFSPFGYKVDFYDGDKHIGEGSVCGVKDNDAFLYDFEVYPEFRGKGYSKEMLQFMIDKYDLKQLYVDQDNKVAINLYTKYGFTIEGDVDDNGKPAYIMTRE